MAGIELVKNRATKEPYPLEVRIGHRVAAAARARGLIIRPIGNVLVLMPPLSTSLAELQKMVAIMRESLNTLTISSTPHDRGAAGPAQTQ
jgi:adenosylmethionine-8-amino-7-oxononanoate aminotransferase